MSEWPNCCCGGALARSVVHESTSVAAGFGPVMGWPVCLGQGTLGSATQTGVGHLGYKGGHRLFGYCLSVYPALHSRFESSSHAISMSAYLREQRRELYSRSGELQGK